MVRKSSESPRPELFRPKGIERKWAPKSTHQRRVYIARRVCITQRLLYGETYEKFVFLRGVERNERKKEKKDHSFITFPFINNTHASLGDATKRKRL